MSASIQELHNQEWLSKICRLAKLTPPRAFLLVVAINLIIDYPLGSSFEVFWFTGKIPRGLLGEPSDWLYDFVVHPTILAYFVWLQSSAEQLFSDLAKRDVISADHLEKEVEWLRNWLQSPWAFILAAVAGLIFVIWFTLAFSPALPNNPIDVPPYASWITKDPIIALVRAPVLFVVFYALIIVLYDLVFIIIAINSVFRNEEIRVEPLNADGAGGLGFIGRFSANLGYLVAALGLLLFARIMLNIAGPEDMSGSLALSEQRNFVFLFGFAAYLIIAPIIFFLPLRSAHAAMVRYRNGLIAGISSRFSDLMVEVRSVPWEDEEQNEDLMKQVRRLVEARETIAKRVPIWPFNSVSLRRFFGVILTPLLAAIISALVNLLFSL